MPARILTLKIQHLFGHRAGVQFTNGKRPAVRGPTEDDASSPFAEKLRQLGDVVARYPLALVFLAWDQIAASVS